jgi:hypothetical protein
MVNFTLHPSLFSFHYQARVRLGELAEFPPPFSAQHHPTQVSPLTLHPFHFSFLPGDWGEEARDLRFAKLEARSLGLLINQSAISTTSVSFVIARSARRPSCYCEERRPFCHCEEPRRSNLDEKEESVVLSPRLRSLPRAVIEIASAGPRNDSGVAVVGLLAMTSEVADAIYLALSLVIHFSPAIEISLTSPVEKLLGPVMANESAPSAVLSLVERFDRAGSIGEATLCRVYLDPLFEALGWDLRNEEGRPECPGCST